MGDEDDRREFIKSNLTELSKSTVIGTELVVRLFEKGLIDDEEEDFLSNKITPNIDRAKTLYKTTANKWDHNKFEEFKNILKETGNSKALQVFTNAGADCFLTNEQVQLLRQQGDKSEDGCYEGLSLEEETTANKIVQYVRSDQLFKEGIFKLSEDLQRREVNRLVRNFNYSLKNKTIWWNPQMPKLPENYIKRRVAKTHFFRNDGKLYPEVKPIPLLEVTEYLVLLVDPPGMGKSSEVTKLENELRIKFSDNRIIVRTNLNGVQKVLSTIKESETAPNVVLKLAPFLASKTLLIPGVRVVLLLDGLDEVCPKHQHTMINLLRILKSYDESYPFHVVVTSRPHLKEAIESEFGLESWSLLPLTAEQQNNYVRAKCVSTVQLSDIRSTITRSVAELLSNPLMLYMLSDVLKSGGNFSGADVNIYDLYSRFVDAKHELHCVEKLRMEEGANYTDVLKESMLSRILPFYYHVALEELDANHCRHSHSSVYIDSLGRTAAETPPTRSNSNVTTELLSYGLLVKNHEKRLVFKHRSFADFFFARLLIQDELASQALRDIVFGCIYEGYRNLYNVEAFLEAALSKRPTRTPLLNITTKWMLTEESIFDRRHLLKKFVGGKLFSLCAPDVLMTFVKGDPCDLRDAFRVLVDIDSRGTFAKLFGWMSENRDWSRRELFKITGDQLATDYTPQSASLMVAIAVNFVGQELLTADEVGVAIMSPHNRLIYTVASSPTKGKWDFVESHLKEGQLKNLLLNANDEDFNRILEDTETACRLVANLSEDELNSLLTNEETRVTDVVGRRPREVLVAFGENLISGLAEFRVKFGDDEGKTVFELSNSGCEFALEFLWRDLLKEKDDNNFNGAVTVALWETFGRSSMLLLENLVYKVRSRRNNTCEPTSDLSLHEKEWEESDGVMDWIFGGASFWKSSSPFPPDFLTFAVLYSGEPHLVASILHPNRYHLRKYSTVNEIVRGLILSASCKENNSPFYSLLATQLKKEFQKYLIPYRMKFVAEVFMGATREELRNATPTSLHSHKTPFDVSYGQVFIKLLQQFPKKAMSKATWGEIVVDVIKFTRCCQLPSVFEELRRKCEDEDRLKQILTQDYVITQWKERFSWEWIKEGEKRDTCGLRNLLAFYFSVFGLNLNWMKEARVSGLKDWELVWELLVEIATALESNPKWTHVLPQFQQIVRKRGMPFISHIGNLLTYFTYRGVKEWERLISLIGWEEPRIPEFEERMTIRNFRAAPLVRVLMKMWGNKRAKDQVSQFWRHINLQICFFGESPESLGSLLHSAIELGELAEVEKRAWPGLLTWRNPLGKDALQVALETWGEGHPITLHIQTITLNF